MQASLNIDDNNYNDYYSLDVDNSSGKIEIAEEVDFDGIRKETKNLNNLNTKINYTFKVPANLEKD